MNSNFCVSGHLWSKQEGRVAGASAGMDWWNLCAAVWGNAPSIAGLHCVALVTHPASDISRRCPSSAIVPPLTPAMKLSPTTFFAATGFSLTEREIESSETTSRLHPVLLRTAEWVRTFWLREKLRGGGVCEQSCDVSRVKSPQWDSVLWALLHSNEISKGLTPDVLANAHTERLILL